MKRLSARPAEMQRLQRFWPLHHLTNYNPVNVWYFHLAGIVITSQLHLSISYIGLQVLTLCFREVSRPCTSVW